MNFRLYNGTNIECMDEPLDCGAEGCVYLSKDKRTIIKIYLNNTQQSGLERRKTLENILGKFNVPSRHNNVKHLYAWPFDIVEKQNGTPVLGIAMATAPGNQLLKHVIPKFFVERLSEAERGPGWHRRISITYRLATALRILHLSGLGHSDLSPKNILVDMNNLAMTLIDCDGLVVPGVHPPNVYGTPWHMAPEIITGDGAVLPSVDTDKHALAVIIYETFFLYHPLRGPKVHHPDPEQDDMIAQGSGALWIEHPSDRSNRPAKFASGGPMSTMPPAIQKIFHRAFVEGLHNPAKRPSAADWEGALKRLSDRVVQCQNNRCLMKAFVVPEANRFACPWCNTPYRHPSGKVPLLRLYRPGGRTGQYRLDDWEVIGFDNRPLFDYHASVKIDPETGGDNAPIGHLVHHKGEWYFRNADAPEIRILQEGGSSPLGVGESTRLLTGTRILLGPKDSARVILVQMINT